MLDNAVITGLGVVSPVGMGKEIFWRALIEKKSGIKKISKFNTDPYPYHWAGEIADFSFEDYVPDKGFRRIADISRYAMAATILAQKDADLKKLDTQKTLLILCTNLGPINMSRMFQKGLIAGDGASPMLFADSTLNAPTGNIALCLGLQGKCHTIIGGGPAGIKATGLAVDHLRTGKTDLAIVVGAEELDEVVHYSFSKFGCLFSSDVENSHWSPFNHNRKGFVMGEGAGAIVLERKEDAIKRNANIYAEVGGWSSAFSLNGNDEVLTKTMSKSIEMGKLEPDSIDYISVGSNGCTLDHLETKALKTFYDKSPLIGSLKPNTGESFSATTFLQIVAASLMMEKETVLPNINPSKMHTEWCDLHIPSEVVHSPFNAALINSIGMEGSCASLVIKRLEV